MDHDLTTRAERALLGALITNPGLLSQLEYLEPRDFTDDLHRAVFTAIRSLREAAALSARDLSAAVVSAAGPRASKDYLLELAASSPNPGHGAAYAQRLVQATAYRRIAADADRLAGQASGGTGHLGLVSAALHGHTAPLAAAGADTAPAVETTPPPAAQPGAAAPGRPAGGQAQREERVLGALLQRHGDSVRILDFLPAAAFTSPGRQEIFRAIRRLQQASQPVDELTVAWELATGSSFSAPGNSEPPAGTYNTIVRLARAHPPVQAPFKEARELITQLDRRAPGRQRASHPGHGQVPAQPDRSAGAGLPGLHPPEDAGPRQDREPRR